MPNLYRGEWKKKIVLVNGTFDILHVGHYYLFSEAKKLGNTLYVLTNTDESIKRLKGKYPFHKEGERRFILESIKYIDEVYLFPEDRITRYLSMILPDVWVKGEEYRLLIDKEEEREAKALGIKIHFLPDVFPKDKYSTSILKNTL